MCFRGGVLRDNVPSLFDSITLRALPFTCDVSAGQVPKVLESLATSRRWRTCEYPIFMASHFPPFPPALFDFLRESAIRFLFRFFFDVCLCVNYSIACSLFFVSTFYFLFFFSRRISHESKKRHEAKNCPALLLILHDDLVLAIMSDDLLRATNDSRLFIFMQYLQLYSCVILLSQLFIASLFPLRCLFSSQFRLYRSRFVVRFLFIFKRHYYSLGLVV